MKHELGGDRAVIIVSALVTILSSSTSVSLVQRSAFAETTCSIVHQKLLQLLNGAMSWKENKQFSSRIVAISVDEAHCVLKL